MATTVGTLLVNVIGSASGLQSALGSAEGTISRFGANVSRIGTRWTAGISLPVAGLLTSIAKVGSSFDDEMSKSVAIMEGVDAKLRSQMEKSAMDLSGKLRFSSKEIAQGYYDLASAGFDAKGSLENIGTVATFAQAGMMKMSNAGEYLAGAVKALGPNLAGANTEAGAMARVADVLTMANNKALGTVEDFSQALTTRFASGMKSVNMSLEEGVGFLMAYAQQNIKGKEASMQAWMALRDVQTKAISSAKAWDTYGVSVYDAAGKMRPMADILDQINMRMKGFSKEQLEKWLATGEMPKIPVGLEMSDKEKRKFMMDLKLPDRSVSSIQKVLSESNTINSYVETLKNSYGEAERVATKQMESIAAKTAAAWHRIENAGIRVFLGLKPVMADLLDMFSDFMDKVDKWVEKFNALDAGTRKMILGFLAAVVVAGPLLMIFGNLLQIGGGIARVAMSIGDGFIGASTGMLKFIMASVKLERDAKGRFMSRESSLLMRIPPEALESWKNMSKVMSSAWVGLQNFGTMLRVVLPRLLALYGIVELAIIPAFKSITSYTGKWWDVLKGIVPPLAALEVLWGKLSGVVSFSIGSWSDWVQVGKDVWAMLGDIVAIIKHGWGLIPDLFAAMGQAWTDSFNALWSGFQDIIKGFQGMKTELDRMLDAIPLLGWAFRKTGEGIAWMFDKAKEALGWIDRKLQEIAKNSANAYGGNSVENLLDLEKKDNPKGNYNGALNQLQTLIHRLAVGTGAVKDPLVSTGFRYAEFKPSIQGSENGKGGPRIPGLGGPPPPETEDAKALKRTQDAYNELMGDGGRKWREYAKAVEEHKKEIYGNADAMDRLWEIYKGVRETVGPNGLTKELDELFADRINVENFQGMGDMFTDLFKGGSKMTDLEKYSVQIEKFVKEQKELLGDTSGLTTGIFSPDFFKKYGDQIEQLNERYSEQSPEIRLLIDEYYKWANAMEATERAGKNFAAGQEALGTIIESHADMVAKVKDKEVELTNSRLSEGGRALRGVSKNYETQKLEFEKQNAAMLNSFKFMNESQLGIAVKTFFENKKLQEEYLKIVKTVDLERVMSAVGMSDRIIRASKHMTDEQKKHLIDLKIKVNEVVKAYQEISQALGQIAAVNDPQGNKTITWLSQLTGLMAQASDAGASMREGFAGIGAAFKAGDWKALGDSAIATFKAVAQAYETMAKATSGTNVARATIGGAATGFQMGAQSGNPYVAVFAALAGGFLGYSRASSAAAREMARQFDILRDKASDIITTFRNANPAIKELDRVMRAFGITMTAVNSEADLERLRRQFEEFGKKLDEVRGKFDTLFDSLIESGYGIPDDIAAYINQLIDLGIITGDLAAKFKGMLGDGEVSWTKMKEAADRYGLSEEKLGKAYNQSKHNSMAKQMINDYDILVRGGADATEVLKAMAPKINQLVLDSMKMGTTIPENMRPWIQKMIELGLLVDANGNKITDMTGINFGPPMATQFEEVTQALRDLIEELRKLPGLFGAAADAANRVRPPRPGPPGEPGDPDDDNNLDDPGDPVPGPGKKTADRNAQIAYNAATADTRNTSAAFTSASGGAGGRSQTVIVLPVAVGDATNIEDLADYAVSRIPEAIADNRANIKHAIVSAARATSVPRTRVRR